MSTPEVMQFGMGNQSQEIRENLSKFSRFLEHFSQAKWLGDLIAPEFKEQKDFAMKIMTHLQTGTQVSLPESGKPTTKCNHCGRTASKTNCICDACSYCVCGCGAHKNKFCKLGCDPVGLRLGTCPHCRCRWQGWRGDFCPKCSRCLHGLYAMCDKGSSQVTVSPKTETAASLCEDLPSGIGSLEKLENLAIMSEALADAFRQDVAARKAAEKAGFAESW